MEVIRPSQSSRRALGVRWPFRHVRRLCVKELRETLRDRRTLATLVLMPLLVYPLLSITFHKLLLTSFQSIARPQYVVGVESEMLARQIQSLLDQGNGLIRHDEPRPTDEPSHGNLRTLQIRPTIDWVITGDPRGSLSTGVVDLAVFVQFGPTENHDKRPGLNLTVVHRAGSPLSQSAMEHVSERIDAVNQAYVRQRLEQLGDSGRLPAELTEESIIVDQDVGISLTAVVPLVLILMTITGAVYPAIDLTAGERERGTLEMLMAAPVPRFGLLVAKYVAVFTVAVLTAIVNLAAMSITLLVTGLSEFVFASSGVTYVTLFKVFALILLFAAFFSAVLLAITSFARSFKEAQAYLIPLMLLSLAPGVLSLMPGVTFNGLLSIVPLLNIVLLARDFMDNTADPRLAIATLVSTGFYTAAAIGLAARIFGTDAVLYGTQSTWSDLFRTPRLQRDVSSLSGAFLCLAILFPASFLASNAIARQNGLSISARILLSGLATALLFGLIPLLVAMLQRVRFSSAFRWSRVNLTSMLGAIILGVSLWPFAHEVYLFSEFLGLASLRSDQIEAVSQMLDQWHQTSPLLIVICLAISPALCEELLFRGYLFTAIGGVASTAVTIISSAALFGVFHVLTTNALATERLLPSTFLGLALGWICYRTGSVIPGMLTHACHNGLLLLAAYYREPLDRLLGLGWVDEGRHVPASWIIGAALGSSLGLVLLRPRKPLSEPENDDHLQNSSGN